MPISMVLVLMSLNIILQEDLYFLRHFWSDVFYEETCDDGDSTEAGQG